jgi:hypothetical protein
MSIAVIPGPASAGSPFGHPRVFEPQYKPAVTHAAPPAIPADTSLEVRWDAWVARGRDHDQRVRGRVLTGLLIVVIVAAFAGALVLSFGGNR